MKQLGAWTMLGIWAVVCLGGALFASWAGYGGRPFAATLTSFSLLLLMTLLLAARGVPETINAKLGVAGGMFVGVFSPAAVPDLFARNIVAGHRPSPGDGWVDFCAAGIGDVGRRCGGGSVARLRKHSGDLDIRKIWAAAVAVAISRREIVARVDGAGRGEHGVGLIFVGAAGKRNWLFDWLGKALGRCMWWAVLYCSRAWRSHWGWRCTSFGLRRNGATGARTWDFRWRF